MTDLDLSRVRRAVSRRSEELGLSLLSRTRLVTAASELARNLLTYAGGGIVKVDLVRQDGRTGIRATFEDRGPGIVDTDLALSDGYSTGHGLGLGLGGAQRLTDEFGLESEVDRGTTVWIINWSHSTEFP